MFYPEFIRLVISFRLPASVFALFFCYNQIHDTTIPASVISGNVPVQDRFMSGYRTPQCLFQFQPMPMIGRETYSYKSLFLHNIYGAEHDSFDEAVHCEVFYSRPLEQGLFHLVCHHKCCSIQKQPEVVRAIGMT